MNDDNPWWQRPCLVAPSLIERSANHVRLRLVEPFLHSIGTYPLLQLLSYLTACFRFRRTLDLHSNEPGDDGSMYSASRSAVFPDANVLSEDICTMVTMSS